MVILPSLLVALPGHLPLVAGPCWRGVKGMGERRLSHARKAQSMLAPQSEGKKFSKKVLKNSSTRFPTGVLCKHNPMCVTAQITTQISSGTGKQILFFSAYIC